jgi:hypothetical protein
VTLKLRGGMESGDGLFAGSIVALNTLAPVAADRSAAIVALKR